MKASYDYVVLGAGVAGMTAAFRLSEGGSRRIVVLEEYPEPGGNQRSCDIGPYTFDVGAFYYWPGMPFFRMFPDVEATCHPAVIRRQRVNPRGEVRRYPYSFPEEFVARGPGYWTRAAASLVQTRMHLKRLDSAEDFARYHMGDLLYRDLGMKNYLQRFYGVPPAEIELEFAAARMEAVQDLATPGAVFAAGGRWLLGLAGSQRPYGEPGRLLVRPRAGFPGMYAPAVSALRARGVDLRFSSGVSKVMRTSKGWSLEGDGLRMHATNLVSAVPITRLCSLLDLPAPEGLRSSDLHTLFFSFDGERRFDACILYNFCEMGAWKRVTVHSDHYGRCKGREYFSVEVPVCETGPQEAAVLADAFRANVTRTGLFRGDLKLEGSSALRHAYPVYTRGTTARLKRIMSQLSAMGVVAVGRQGRFDYLPSGKKVVEQVDRFLRQ